MNKKRRLEKILDMLKIDGTITIKEIIDELDISDMTARRDLDALEADGLLTRTHGGAQLLSSKKPLEKTHIEKKSLNTKEKIDLLLLGGEYREITGAFVGSMASTNLKAMRFAKAFVSANAVTHNSIATYSDKEGVIQQLALNNAVEKFLLVDSTKFDRYDFFNFYNLDKLDTIITDNQISPQHLEEFSQYTTILKAD